MKINPIKTIVFKEDGWINSMIDIFESLISDAIMHRGVASVMLTGGNTAKKLYLVWAKVLAAKGDRNIIFYFSDERCVPLSHPDSNYRMVFESLFNSNDAWNERIKKIDGSYIDVDTIAQQYGDSLPFNIDILILTLGLDGHIASLFPNSNALLEDIRKIAFIPSAGELVSRLTITPLVLKNARNIFVLAIGSDKGDTLARVFDDKSMPSDFPAKLLHDGLWILDDNANIEFCKYQHLS